MQRYSAWLAVGVSILLIGSPAHAQDSRFYIGGSFTISPWSVSDVDEGTPSTSYSNETSDTKVTGVAFAGGFNLSPRWSFGIDVGRPFARHNVRQQFGYLTPFIRESAYRDTTVFGEVRFKTRLRGRVTPVLAGGIGRVAGESRERTSFGRFGSNVFEPFGPETKVTHSTLGAVVGGDVMLTAGSHFAVSPQFRLFMVDRGNVIDGPNSFASFGLPSVFYRVAIGIFVF